jgi:dTDP-4-dehydrorhamnose reductase
LDLRILVTGAGGMLGRDVCEVLVGSNEVAQFDIEEFDVADATATEKAIRGVAPEVVVHLAAFTNVEACEDEKERAFRVNALGTMNVARAARDANAHLVYVSTDYVFDGTKTEPYVEDDEPNPINYYGRTKLYGELYVRDLAASHLIIRTSWLFGPLGPNFVDRIIAKASEGGPLQVVNDQTGCPTYTMDLARGIGRAVELGLKGVLHLTNSGATTWFGLASHAIGLAGVTAEVVPVASADYPTKARRPSNSVLASLVVPASGMEHLPPWQDAVREHLSRRGMLKESAAN